MGDGIYVSNKFALSLVRVITVLIFLLFVPVLMSWMSNATTADLMADGQVVEVLRAVNDYVEADEVAAKSQQRFDGGKIERPARPPCRLPPDHDGASHVFAQRLSDQAPDAGAGEGHCKGDDRRDRDRTGLNPEPAAKLQRLLQQRILDNR